MKKIFILILLIFSFAFTQAQRRYSIFHVPNSSTLFGITLPANSIVCDENSGTIYGLTAKYISTKDLDDVITDGNYITYSNSTGIDYDSITTIRKQQKLLANAPSYWYDMVDDYIQITASSSIQNLFAAGGSVILRTYIESDGETSQGRFYTIGGNATYFETKAESGGFVKLKYLHEFSGTDGIWETTTASVPINQWICIVLSYDGSNVANDPIIYLNGNSLALTETSTPIGTITPTNTDWYIGNSSIGSRTFDGQFNAFSLYDITLTEAQVKTLSQGGDLGYGNEGVLDLNGAGVSDATWYDQSGNGNDGTVLGAVAYNQNSHTVFDTVTALGVMYLDGNAYLYEPVFLGKAGNTSAKETYTASNGVTGYTQISTADEYEIKGYSGGVVLDIGASIDEFSTDETLAGNSDDALPTEKAVKTYVDNATTAKARAVIYFQDKGVGLTVTASGTWYQVTNATNDIFSTQNLNDISVSGDTIYFSRSSRYYNIDVDLGMKGNGNENWGATLNRSGSERSPIAVNYSRDTQIFPIPFSWTDEISNEDWITLEVKNSDDTDDATFNWCTITITEL